MTTVKASPLRFVGTNVAHPEDIVDCGAIHEVYMRFSRWRDGASPRDAAHGLRAEKDSEIVLSAHQPARAASEITRARQIDDIPIP